MSTPIGSVTGTQSNSAAAALTGQNATVSQNQFLQLLVTQLQNQDPDNPTDQTQMLAQLAQFSSLAQMQTLNQTLTGNAQFTQLAQSAALIGKTVTAGPADQTVTGTVASVSVQNGQTLLHIGTQDVDASTVSSIN